MGGNDTVGFSLNNTYGSYQGVSCVSGFEYITDHNQRSSYFYTPITPDYSKGVYFTFQDQWYSGVGGEPYDTKYFGEGFSCCATYDSKFVNYHGNCDGFVVISFYTKILLWAIFLLFYLSHFILQSISYKVAFLYNCIKTL
jgi:hypothetical protein